MTRGRPRSTWRSGSPQPGQAEADERDGGSSLARVLVTQSQACPGGSCSHLSWAPAAAQDAGVRGFSWEQHPWGGYVRRSERLFFPHSSPPTRFPQVGSCGVKQPLQWHVIGACASHSPEGT